MAIGDSSVTEASDTSSSAGYVPINTIGNLADAGDSLLTTAQVFINPKAVIVSEVDQFSGVTYVAPPLETFNLTGIKIGVTTI